MKIRNADFRIRATLLNGQNKVPVKRRFVPTAALLALSLLLISCGEAPYKCSDPLGCLEISPGSPVVIGALLALYGNQRGTGLQALDEIETAIEETGQILGHDIELAWQGTDCTEENARLSATLLTRTTDLLAVIGPTCAADARIALPILEDAGLSVISPSPSATDAFGRLVSAIQQAAIRHTDGMLIIPGTVLQHAIQDQP
jgi:ABC-type branched-subunit amino acid transport system substrate-binding protein